MILSNYTDPSRYSVRDQTAVDLKLTLLLVITTGFVTLRFIFNSYEIASPCLPITINFSFGRGVSINSFEDTVRGRHHISIFVVVIFSYTSLILNNDELYSTTVLALAVFTIIMQI